MTSIPDSDPGARAAVPFDFDCHRCGNCCTAGAGYVWLEDEDVQRLARRLGLDEAVFRARLTRTVVDPGSGRLRVSLRERDETGGGSGGRCVFLEGRAECGVYTDRPAHCATFPYWPSVLAGGAGFEAARGVCPGIRVRVDEATRRAAFDRLEALYREVDAAVTALAPRCELSGRCCRFEEAGHELYATGLEADFALEHHPDPPPPEAPGRCPYHVGGLCTAREGRALGCRTYFCDERTSRALEDLHADFLARLRAIERETGYPASYGPFPAFLAVRAAGSEVAGDPEAAGKADSGKTTPPAS